MSESCHLIETLPLISNINFNTKLNYVNWSVTNQMYDHNLFTRYPSFQFNYFAIFFYLQTIKLLNKYQKSATKSIELFYSSNYNNKNIDAMFNIKSICLLFTMLFFDLIKPANYISHTDLHRFYSLKFYIAICYKNSRNWIYIISLELLTKLCISHYIVLFFIYIILKCCIVSVIT